MERRVRREFQDLLDCQERGEEVDTDRLYVLQLYARKSVGESLQANDVSLLSQFERNEGLRESSPMHSTSSPLPGKLEEVGEARYLGGNVHDASSMPLSSEIATPSVDHDSDDSSMSASEVEELDRLLLLLKSDEEIDKERLSELLYFDRWKRREDLNESEMKSLDAFRRRRREERRLRRNVKSSPDGKPQQETDASRTTTWRDETVDTSNEKGDSENNESQESKNQNPDDDSSMSSGEVSE